MDCCLSIILCNDLVPGHQQSIPGSWKESLDSRGLPLRGVISGDNSHNGYNYLRAMEIHIISNHIYLNQNNYLMMCWSSSSQSLRQYRGMNYCQLKKEFLQMMTNPVFCCWGWNFVKRHRNLRGYEQILYSRIRCVLVALFGRLVNLLPWVSPLIPQSKMVPSYNFTKKSHYHDHLDDYHEYCVGHFEDHRLTWNDPPQTIAT